MNWSLVQMDGVWQKQRGEKKKGSVARSQEQEPSRRMGQAQVNKYLRNVSGKTRRKNRGRRTEVRSQNQEQKT